MRKSANRENSGVLIMSANREPKNPVLNRNTTKDLLNENRKDT